MLEGIKYGLKIDVNDKCSDKLYESDFNTEESMGRDFNYEEFHKSPFEIVCKSGSIEIVKLFLDYAKDFARC